MKVIHVRKGGSGMKGEEDEEGEVQLQERGSSMISVEKANSMKKREPGTFRLS